MIVVFSGNTSWSMYNFRLMVMKKFQELGHKVVVVTPVDNFAEKLITENIEVVPILKMERSGTNPIRDYGLYREYVKVYKKIKPDFIFHYTIKPNIYGTLAAKKCKIPCISIATGLGNAFANTDSLIFYFAKQLYKFSSRFAKQVWFLNTTDQELFIQHKIIPKEKSFLLPGEGINLSLFSPSKSPLKADHKEVRFLLIARMLYDKGVSIFAEASQILLSKGYEFSALLLGQLDYDNPQKISIETIKEWEAKGLVKYLGSTSHVQSYIDAADCIVLPTYYKEGIPRVLLEASCMEKPIITTINPGCTDIVKDGVNGFLCNPKDAVSLADMMEKFIHTSEEERNLMGKNGRNIIEANFDEQHVIDIYLEQWKKQMQQEDTAKVKSMAFKKTLAATPVNNSLGAVKN